MAYEVRYRIDIIAARADGSELVGHGTWAEGKEEGEESWVVVPGHHRSVYVPAAEVQAALAAGSNAQVVAAYKDALVANVNTRPDPITGWSKAAIQSKLAANAAATAASAAINSFVTDTLGVSFPVTFTL